MLKLSKQSPLFVLSNCVRVTPIALTLVAGSFACGQTVQNRYTQPSVYPNPYTVPVQPSYTYPADVYRSHAQTFHGNVHSGQSVPPTVQYYEVQPSSMASLPAPALRYAPPSAGPGTVYETIPPRRPANERSRLAQPSNPLVPPLQSPGVAAGSANEASSLLPKAAPKPATSATPNFADMQDVGRGLGTPGLITPGSVQRMEQSGLVVEDFRPPQPKQEDFSLEGLPPEARRAFYDQLQIPEGGRVMSARVLSSELAPSVTSAQSEAVNPDVSGAAAVESRDAKAALEDASQAHDKLAGDDKKLVQPKANALTRDLESTIDRVPDTGASPAAEPIKASTDTSSAVPDSRKDEQLGAPKTEENASQKVDAGLQGVDEAGVELNERFAKQQAEIETVLAKVMEQNAALSLQLNSVSERLAKLEKANVELDKKLRESDAEGKKLGDREDNKAEGRADKKQKATPDSEKDKENTPDIKENTPDKKGRKKSKDRIEV